MNSKNSKTSYPQELLTLQKGEKKCCFIKLQRIRYMENFKSTYKNNRLKMSVSAQNNECNLPVGSYSVSNIVMYHCISVSLKNLRQ